MDGKIAIIGTGTTGSMIMWRSSLLSKGIVGFDGYQPGSDNTAVGGDSRMFRLAYKEGAQFSGLLADSERLWHELNDLSGTTILDQRGGGLTISTQDGEYHRSLLDSASSTGAQYKRLTAEELERSYPQHALLPGDAGLLDPRAGLLRTDLAVLRAMEQAEANGAVVNRNTRIEAITPRDGYVEVHAGEKTWTFEKVVISSGAWSGDLLPARYGEYLRPGRILLTWYAARNPEEFTRERFPVFLRDSAELHMWGAPTLDGATVKLGGIIPPEEIAHPTTMSRDLDTSEIERSDDAVRQLLPGLFPSCIRSKAYPDLYSADAQPMIGWLADMPGVYLATGFSGKGFKMASGVGEAVAKDLFGTQPASNIGFADPSRFWDGTAHDASWGRLKLRSTPRV